MNKITKHYMVELTKALSSRKKTPEQWDFIYRAQEKCPKIYARCQKLAKEVRKRVDANILETWEETAKDEGVNQ